MQLWALMPPPFSATARVFQWHIFGPLPILPTMGISSSDGTSSHVKAWVNKPNLRWKSIRNFIKRVFFRISIPLQNREKTLSLAAQTFSRNAWTADETLARQCRQEDRIWLCSLNLTTDRKFHPLQYHTNSVSACAGVVAVAWHKMRSTPSPLQMLKIA